MQRRNQPPVAARPPDWDGVRRACEDQRWVQAYGFAHNDPAAIAHIEARKAERLAEFTQQWRHDHGKGS